MKKALKLSIAGIFLLILGVAFQNCNSLKPVANRLEGKELITKLQGIWILKTIDRTDVKDAFKGPMPTLTFDFNNHRISGNGGCNQYNGGFTLVENILTPTPMVSTRMACMHENQESKLLKLLGEKSTLVFNNYTLQFVQNGKVVLEFIPRAR